MNKIKQTHFGSGDNIAGDKTFVLNDQVKEKTIPMWAQWVGWITSVVIALITIYTLIN